jgi:hypothetical protein
MQHRGPSNPWSVFVLILVLSRLASCWCPAQEAREPRIQKRDFSKTNSVTIDLTQEANEGGLTHLHLEKDGRTTLMGLNGAPCRCLHMPERATAYLYFIIDQSFKENDLTNVRIDVEFFDGLEPNSGTFSIHYDATGMRESGEPAYTRTEQSGRLRGTKTWRTASFQIRDGAFQNSQNSGADFRIVVSPAEFCVRRVTVTRVERKNDDAFPGSTPFFSPEKKTFSPAVPKPTPTE